MKVASLGVLALTIALMLGANTFINSLTSPLALMGLYLALVGLVYLAIRVLAVLERDRTSNDF